MGENGGKRGKIGEGGAHINTNIPNILKPLVALCLARV